jgi:Leucine-rich repeat (LRR) protein
MDDMRELSGLKKMMLTEFIFQQVQEFLTYPYILVYGKYPDNVSDINKLLNVSRNMQSLKYSEFYWKLKRQYSLKYYMDIDFKTRGHLLLNDTKSQLSLDLSYFKVITGVTALGNVHALALSNSDGITDVSALCDVHTLSLGFCAGISDISALGKVHTLNIHHCPIKDVSALGNVAYVKSNFNSEITVHLVACIH